MAWFMVRMKIEEKTKVLLFERLSINMQAAWRRRRRRVFGD